MKISKSELIKLLSEHLGSDETSVNSQLDKLIADINKAIEKGETFTINGLGQFSRDDQGLSFEISKGFATEINYNYEGRMPVDIDRAAAKDIEAAAEKAAQKPSTSKKNIIIVDDEVEGEEDPFGVEDVDSTSAVPVESDDQDDESPFVTDMETSSQEVGTDEAIHDASADSLNIPDKTESNSIIDDTVDDEELAIIEEVFSGKDPEDAVLQDNDDLDDFFLEESDREEVLSAADDVSVAEEHIEIDDIFDLDESEDQDKKFAEEVASNGVDGSNELLQDDVAEPDELVASDANEQMAESIKKGIRIEESTIQPSVLDDYFNPEKSESNTIMMPEQVFPESDDESVGSAVGTETEETNEDGSPKHGPRIISLEEAKADDKISVGDILKYVAMLVVVFILAGGVWWLFMGAGKVHLAKLPFMSSQPVATYQVDTPILTGSEIDQSVVAAEDVESAEESIAGTEEVIGDLSSTSDVPSQAGVAGAGTAQASTSNEIADTQPVTQPTVQQPVQSQPATPVTQPVTDTPATPRYGLTGAYSEINGPVYSIIVHSLPTQTAAQNECIVISSLNLRCFVREATGPQGRRTFRVAIGQFASTIDAQNAIRELQEPFRTQNFIARTN